MAITKIINAVDAAIPEDEASAFDLESPSIVDCWGLTASESVIIYRLMSDGAYHPMTSDKLTVALYSMNNSIILEPGSYKLVKGVTTNEVSAGWEALY